MTYALDARVRELAVAFGTDQGAQDAAIEAAQASAGPGIGEYASLAAAVAANGGGSIRINYDEQALPADFAGVLLEYTKMATARNITQSGWSVDQAMRTLRSQHPAGHPDEKLSTLNIEALATGSFKNGPNSSDYGASINVAKQGFFSGTPLSGEIDGLTIYVRQDGPKGLPSGDPGSSDAAGILINAQNVGDCGWLGGIEISTSNIDPVTAAITRSIQTQMGVHAGNTPSGPLSYGFVAMATAGQHEAAFYASESGGGTFKNLFFSPGDMAIGGDGAIKFRPSTFDDWLGRIERATGANGAMQITQTGTGGIGIMNQANAPIIFGVSNTNKAQVTNSALSPVANAGMDMGTTALRWSQFWGVALNLSGGQVTLSALPTYADNAAALAGGLTAGRVYRTTTGQLMVTI